MGLPFAPRPLSRRIRPYDPEEVTRRNEALEVEPAEAGLEPEAVRAIWDAVVLLYRTRLYPAIGLCLRRRGRVVIDRTIGHRIGNGPDDPPGTPAEVATPDTLFNLFSASKSVTAMLVHLCDQRGLLRLDDPVVEYIPEFGRHGKHWITLRHLLTHRAGIPAIPGGRVDLDLLADHRRILEVLCDARPVTPPGRRLEYHAMTGGYLLAEVIRRVSGRGVRELLESEVLRPLGFRAFTYGVRPEDRARTARNEFTGIPAVFPASWALRRSLGMDMAQVVEVSNDPRFLAAVVPSGNLHGTAEEGSRFFQLMLCGGELDGVRVFDRRTVRRAVGEQTYFTFDFTIWLPLGYGMGFMLGHEFASLFGPGSPKAFGHIGFTNTLVYADPERDIAVSLQMNGKPFITPELVLWYNVTRVIAARCPRDGRASWAPPG